MPALRDVVLRYMCHAWTSRYRAGALHPNLTRPPGSLADSSSGLWEKGSFGSGKYAALFKAEPPRAGARGPFSGAFARREAILQAYDRECCGMAQVVKKAALACLEP